jgi:hypothetical protein
MLRKSCADSGDFEPLYLALSASHRLVKIFGRVCLFLMRCLWAGQAKVQGRAAGIQLVGDQQFRYEPVTQQLADQPERRALSRAPIR